MPPIKIALKGFGIAGQARLTAIQSQPKEFFLSALVSRHSAQSSHSWEEVLADPEIEAVAISTENTDHETSVLAALLAKKHVLCDYPLCFSETQARKLYSFAQAQQKILHVEHMGLLSEEHQNLKPQIKSLGPLIEGEFVFQGGFSKKLTDPQWSGPMVFSALPRLLQIVDLFGPTSLKSYQFDLDDTGFCLRLDLKTQEQGNLRFIEEHRKDKPRQRQLRVRLQQGELRWQSGTLRGGLFLKDLLWFYSRVRNNKTTAYYSEAQLVECIALLEEISLQKGPLSRS